MSARVDTESKVVYIEQLMRDLQRGRLRIPAFQRSLAWTDDQMLSLLNSMQHGYPIGSLVFWETTEYIHSLKRIGPLPVSIEELPGGMASYVLDGSQRLTTLYGALLLNDKEAATAERKWRIYYDLETEKFVCLEFEPTSQYFPCWKLLDTVEFIVQAKKIITQVGNIGESYIERARGLARIFLQYTIPVTIIRGASTGSAVDVFMLLNTTGRRVTSKQLTRILQEAGTPGLPLDTGLQQDDET